MGIYRRLLVLVIFCVAVNSACANTEVEVDSEVGVTLSSLVETLAESDDIKIIYPGELAGIKFHSVDFNLSAISYSELSIMLSMHDYLMYKEGGLHVVVKKRRIRSSPIPHFNDGGSYLPSQAITKVIRVENACVSRLLPSIRPLVSTFAHLAGDVASNTIVVTDIYSNIQRVESIILDLDSHTKKQKDCSEKRVSAVK